MISNPTKSAQITIYYQIDSNSFPNGITIGDLVLVTSTGTSTGTIKEQWIYSIEGWYQTYGEGTAPVSGSVLDNTIFDSELVITSGRYIVPASGTSNLFVGNENKYVDYDGSSFVFSAPLNNDRVVITSGINSGVVFSYSTATTSWTQPSVASAALPTNAVTNLPTSAGAIYSDSTDSVVLANISASTPIPLSPINIIGALNAIPTVLNPSGLYYQYGGTLPTVVSGSPAIALNDIYYWNATTLKALKYIAYAQCPSSLVVGSTSTTLQSHCKSAGGWVSEQSVGQLVPFLVNCAPTGGKYLRQGSSANPYLTYPILGSKLALINFTNSPVTMPSASPWAVGAVKTDNSVAVYLCYNSTVSARSVDNGATWQAVTLPVSLTVNSMCWSQRLGLFVVVCLGSAVVLTSPDGLTWTQRSIGNAGQWNGIVDTGTSLVATTSGQVTATSVDAITWTVRTTNMPSGGTWGSLTYNATNKFLMVVNAAGAPAALCATSIDDGVTWSQMSLGGTGGTWTSCSNGTVTVAIASATTVAIVKTSATALNIITLPTAYSISNITWIGNCFIATSSGSRDAYYSQNGLAWTYISLSGTAHRSPLSINNKFYGNSYNNTVATLYTTSYANTFNVPSIGEPSNIQYWVIAG